VACRAQAHGRSFAEHQKLIDEDARLETEIKALDNITDYHTVEPKRENPSSTRAARTQVVTGLINRRGLN
jgi:hypothetical protein